MRRYVDVIVCATNERLGLRGGVKRTSNSPPKAGLLNPVEELLNIEMVSNALHTLAASSMRFAM